MAILCVQNGEMEDMHQTYRAAPSQFGNTTQASTYAVTLPTSSLETHPPLRQDGLHLCPQHYVIWKIHVHALLRPGSQFICWGHWHTAAWAQQIYFGTNPRMAIPMLKNQEKSGAKSVKLYRRLGGDSAAAMQSLCSHWPRVLHRLRQRATKAPSNLENLYFSSGHQLTNVPTKRGTAVQGGRIQP